MKSINDPFAFYITDDIEINIKFDFFKILKKEKHYIIYIKNLEEDLRWLLSEGSNYYISDGKFLFINFYMIENALNNNIDFQNLELKVSNESEIELYKDNFYADLVYSWKNNETKYKWYNLSTLRKKIWLGACRDKFNIIPNGSVNNNIHVYFKLVKTMLDFYCHFGDVCLGYHGYMGSNLDALDDCLARLKASTKGNLTFVFHDFNAFKKQILSERKFKKYDELIIDIFKSNKVSFEIK
jgi:RNAse (barnase) inhibitor barstar